MHLIIEKFHTDELSDEISFIIGDSVRINCFKNSTSWWDANYEEIKRTLESNLKVENSITIK